MTLPFTKIRYQAEKATIYAQEFIQKGSTQLITNTFDKHQRQALLYSLNDLRNLIANNTRKYSRSLLEYDQYVTYFYESVKQSKKFSLGNCQELALLALHYIAVETSLNAEVYRIKGGDHIFLVIGRPRDSNPNIPETWGENTYICDPWSNLVYPASQYQTRLKNFYSDILYINNEETEDDLEEDFESDFTNNVEDFDPKKHQLEPQGNFNTTYIRKYNTNEHLNEVFLLFQSKQQKIISATNRLNADLNKIATRLKNKYGENDDKYLVIKNKIVHVETLILELNQKFSTGPDTLKQYQDINSVLNKELVSSLLLTTPCNSC